jgi:glycosyltransferase involved in cell wall biosynthesis
MTPKRALIVFPDEWINYSPSMLNSIALLSQRGYAVELLSFGFSHFNASTVNSKHTHITIPFIVYKWLGKIKAYEPLKYWLLMLLLFFKRNTTYGVVIGVDNIGYGTVRAFFKHAIFFSLEVKKDKYFTQCLQLGITHCIIQSAERYHFLFDDSGCTPAQLIVQNAPIIPTNFNVSDTEINARTKQLVYWGNIANFYGIEPLIDALILLPNQYTLTLRGVKNEVYHTHLQAKYATLIQAQRLLFNYDYVPQELLLNQMKQYYIGFVMFDFSKIKTSDFNCVSSPSGKQFNYMAAGLPTIGQDIIGFAPIAQNNAGILLPTFDAQSVVTAINTIENNYSTYAHNAVKASIHYDFNTCFTKAINSVLEN